MRVLNPSWRTTPPTLPGLGSTEFRLVRKRLVGETRRRGLWALRRDVADSVKGVMAIVAMGLSARAVGRPLRLGACTSGECRAGGPVGAAARTRVNTSEPRALI
jgi:hypothetical protein